MPKIPRDLSGRKLATLLNKFWVVLIIPYNTHDENKRYL